jgi:hypothetical protein
LPSMMTDERGSRSLLGAWYDMFFFPLALCPRVAVMALFF